MKRISYGLILLAIVGLLSGCSNKSSSSMNDSPALTGNKGLEQALNLPDDELVNKYCSTLDLCLGDDLLFTDAETIPSQTLFTFFCYITNSYGSDYQEKWYIKVDNNYRVPVVDIKEILNRYFDGCNFDPVQINGYQEQTNEIVIGGISGFGGGRFSKLVKKEQLNNDTLKLTVDYYDDQYKTVFYTKVYTIGFAVNGYQYLSILKIFEKNTDGNIIMLGKYIGEPYNITSSFIPVMTFYGNKTFIFELGINNTIVGTYTTDNNKLVLNTNGGESYTFKITEHSLKNTQEIPNVKVNTNFKLLE